MTSPSVDLSGVLPWAATFVPSAGNAVFTRDDGSQYIRLTPGTYSLVLTTECDKSTYLSVRRNASTSGSFINVRYGEAETAGVPKTLAPVIYTVGVGETADVRVFTSPVPDAADVSYMRRAAVQVLPLPAQSQP